MNKHGACILVVDDEREILRALQRSLVAHGYHVLTATGGKEAVNMIFQQRFMPIEYDLLKLFIHQRGKILTRDLLLQEVWGGDEPDRRHSLHAYVARLRQKIELVPERPRFILTIPGVGYRFQEQAEETVIPSLLRKS